VALVVIAQLTDFSTTERARSISPTKSSPANTPTTSRLSTVDSPSLSLSPPTTLRQGETRRDKDVGDAMEKLTSTSPKESQFDGDVEPKSSSSGRASQTSASLSRKPTLSWQQRPNSQASERPRSRPLSIVATENAARSPRGTPEPYLTSPPGETTLTRDQIAQSLASKDPAWFRQTADRGVGSPAYRKNQVEDEDRSDHGLNTSRVQMPGMSRETSESEKSAGAGVDRSSSPLRISGGFASRSSGLGSPIPMTSAQRFDPPSLDSLSDTRMSPSQGRISPERLDRPASPTKGMGGFVQSAMMKRSDSVNKRWSVQSPPGLNRGNSVASSRSSHDTSAPLASTVNTSNSRPNSQGRDNSPRPSSRPTSSHSNATVTQDVRPGTSSSMRSSMTASTSNDGFVKPSAPASRQQTPLDIKIGKENTSGDRQTQLETASPSSPSKTMDTRRWSPTKSSWLESALNKPDTPKPKPTPPPQQPSWMSEINKVKQKGSVDLGRSPTVAPKHGVSIGGLMRSPPPGGLIKPISMGGLPAGFTSGTTPKGRSESISSLNDKLSTGNEESPTVTTPTPIGNLKPSPPILGKAKPETPPKKDFRAALKPRTVASPSGAPEPEFKNVFGQLRSTKTQNYVAPDELKNNITRGKAALNITGGPKKTERKDEFKEAILKKKDDFKKAQAEGKGITRETSVSKDAAIPEALSKRQALARSNISTEESRPTSSSPQPQESSNALSSTKDGSTPSRLQGKEAIGGKLAGRLNPALAGLLARGPPSVGSETSRSSSPAISQRTVSMSTSTSAEASESGPQLTHMTKGRARGPRRKAPSSVPAATTEPRADADNQAKDNQAKVFVPKSISPTRLSTDTAPITIPKASEPAQAVSPQHDTMDPVSQPSSPQKLNLKRRSQFLQEAPNKINKSDPQLDSPRSISPTKKANTAEIPVNTRDIQPEAETNLVALAKPGTPTKSPTINFKSIPNPSATIQAESSGTVKIRPSPLPPKRMSDSSSKGSPTKSPEKEFPSNSSETMSPRPSPLSPRKIATDDAQSSPTTQRLPIIEKRSSQSVKNTAAMWDRSTNAEAPISPRARSPIKLPTHDDEKAAMIGAGLRPTSPLKPASPAKRPAGLAIEANGFPVSTRPLPTPTARGHFSSPPSAGLMAPASPTKSNYSPTAQASDAFALVSEFFGQNESPPDFVADTAEILSARPHYLTAIKTSQANLYQFTSDGKKQLIPNHQERLLFEGNMYLCVHAFRNAVDKKIIEVYLWIGDEVPRSSSERARTFAQKEAKATGGDLIMMAQGKETPEFFQALGGIIIVRRGSSNKYDSLAPHILCGRKHQGQIAFDEVDYSTASLCSGFPYLISTQSGKAYLWKGKGSGIDELSCARLIGMDFGLTGECEEIDEGNEPASFLQVFGDGAVIPKSADHWRMKPNYTKYCGRLFCANSAAKSQVSNHRHTEDSTLILSLDRRDKSILPIRSLSIHHLCFGCLLRDLHSRWIASPVSICSLP
jgi:hypothetical protein